MLPVNDILTRSIGGFVFIVPMLMLYYILLKMIGRKQNLLHIATAFLFCYYVFGVLTITGIGYTKLRHFSPKVVLTPFISMISGPIDTILNVILFVPLGFFLPALYKKFQHIARTALAGFLFSLSVEIVQMFDWGATDINDLITNTAGACIGYLIYRLLTKVIHGDFYTKLQAEKINETIEVLFIIALVFVIMITLQPWVVHDIIKLS